MTNFIWMTGTTTLHEETRLEGKSMVFGYRLDGGPFTEAVRLTFDTQEQFDEMVAVTRIMGVEMVPERREA